MSHHSTHIRQVYYYQCIPHIREYIRPAARPPVAHAVRVPAPNRRAGSPPRRRAAAEPPRRRDAEPTPPRRHAVEPPSRRTAEPPSGSARESPRGAPPLGARRAGSVAQARRERCRPAGCHRGPPPVRRARLQQRSPKREAWWGPHRHVQHRVARKRSARGRREHGGQRGGRDRLRDRLRRRARASGARRVRAG